ncbi:MAG: MerR family transcriptional regulator [Lachnospiraceae bacterium]|nr:MerR family transcriptional regulator [Lachnospiraceae bacterium]
MTIKEVEKVLDIPRATVRFYEKEGLIDPQREDNGYRDYKDEDIDKLKKIIVLRKIGLAVSDIEDIFDGVKAMPDVLADNITKLEKQMEELKGAMTVCKKMEASKVELATFDTEKYWSIIVEEEKNGHAFMDIAKDIARLEKKVITSYFSWTDSDGKAYDSLPKFIINVLGAFTLTGCIFCLIRREWSISNFLCGVVGILYIILVEAVISIPLYFLGKKFKWIEKNRTKTLVIVCLILCVVLIVLGNVFDF